MNTPGQRKKALVKLLMSTVILGIVSCLILFTPIDWEKIGNWGYLGVFMATLIGSIGVFLPVPSMLVVIRASTHLNPVLLGSAAGAGSTIGEMAFYLTGYSGRKIAEGRWFDRTQNFFLKYGFGCILVLGLIPNPLFDAVGGIAGVLRYPWWKFMLACFLGKSIKFTIAATAPLAQWSCDWFPVTCEYLHTGIR